jgi:hypothetical protein
VGSAPRAAKQVQNVKNNEERDIGPKSQAIDHLRCRAMALPNKKSISDFHASFGEREWPSSGRWMVQHLCITATDDSPIRGHS